MPYPLEKLQYGLRRRLRELTTPAETYAFQIAAPQYSGFQPIQKCKSLYDATLNAGKQNDLLITPSHRNNYVKVLPDQLFIIIGNLVIDDLTLIHKDILRDNFRLNPECITFRDCIVDIPLIQVFNDLLRKPVYELGIEKSTISVKNAIKIIDDICYTPAFKSITDLNILAPESINTWLKALDKAKCSSLKQVNFFNVGLSAFDFERDRFMKFFKNQKFNIYFLRANNGASNKAEDFFRDLFRQFRSAKYCDFSEDEEHYVLVAKKVTLNYGWEKRYYWLEK